MRERMKKNETEERKEQAFSQYALGKSLREIEKDTGIHYPTLKCWKKKFDWKQRKMKL